MKKQILITVLCVAFILMSILSFSSCKRGGTDTDTNTDTSTETSDNTDTEIGTNIDTEINTDTNSDANTDTNSDTNTDTNVDTDTDFVKSQFTVTFESESGMEMSPQIVFEGEKAEEPIPPQKAGYDFEGWYLGSDKWLFDVYAVTDNITLVAQWKAREHTLLFDGNGATNGTMEKMTVSTDEVVVLPENQFVKEGYIFTGWSTKRDGRVEYSDTASYTVGTEDTYILYAVWRRVNTDDPLSEIMKDYEGETINILAPIWTAPNPSYPWSQVELCVTDWDKDANGFGTIINNAVMERNQLIEQTYGVKLNWVTNQGPSMVNRLSEAKINQTIKEKIHIALPYAYEAMSIAVKGSVYTIGNEYMNLEASYYNQESIEKYTLDGKTLFIGGDISFLDEQTANVIFFNADVAKELGEEVDLYQLALSGNWTIDTLYELAGEVSESLDGNDSSYTDNDKYGFATSRIVEYYQYFGIYQTGRWKNSLGQETFCLALQDERVSDVISKMLFPVNNKQSIRTSWTGGFSAMATAFSEDRVLFYNEVMQRVFTFDSDTEVGVIPFPKLNTYQERYYVPFTKQATVACIPKATPDRVLSECMLEILSKTASEYIMPAYMKTIKNSLHKNQAESSVKVIEEQIFPNLMYDIGYLYGKYSHDNNGLATGCIQAESVAGNYNNFQMAYMNGQASAEIILDDWSYAYINYKD